MDLWLSYDQGHVYLPQDLADLLLLVIAKLFAGELPLHPRTVDFLEYAIAVQEAGIVSLPPRIVAIYRVMLREAKGASR